MYPLNEKKVPLAAAIISLVVSELLPFFQSTEGSGILHMLYATVNGTCTCQYEPRDEITVSITGVHGLS